MNSRNGSILRAYSDSPTSLLEGASIAPTSSIKFSSLIAMTVKRVRSGKWITFTAFRKNGREPHLPADPHKTDPCLKPAAILTDSVQFHTHNLPVWRTLINCDVTIITLSSAVTVYKTAFYLKLCRCLHPFVFHFKMLLVICAFGSVLLGTGLNRCLLRDYTQGSERQFDFFFKKKNTLEKKKVGWTRCHV